MKEAALKWYRQAKHDLKMAEGNIDIGGFDIAAFLSHQAVEKLLKAIIILEGKNPPKSHYLDEIAHILGLPDEVIEYLDELSVDYMFSRYPDVSNLVPFEEYDREIAAEKVSIAKKIFEQLKDKYKSLEELA